MRQLVISDKDVERIIALVRTEVSHKHGAVSQDDLQQMYRGVVDAVLNRVISPHYPNTVKGVIEQLDQFSAIYPRAIRGKSAAVTRDGQPMIFHYQAGGELRKVEAWRYIDRVNLEYLIPNEAERRAFSDYIRGYIKERQTSGPSHPHLNYFNPHATNPESRFSRWTKTLWDYDKDEARAGASVAGSGDYIHVHGTAPPRKPVTPYTIEVKSGAGHTLWAGVPSIFTKDNMLAVAAGGAVALIYNVVSGLFSSSDDTPQGFFSKLGSWLITGAVAVAGFFAFKLFGKDLMQMAEAKPDTPARKHAALPEVKSHEVAEAVVMPTGLPIPARDSIKDRGITV